MAIELYIVRTENVGIPLSGREDLILASVLEPGEHYPADKMREEFAEWRSIFGYREYEVAMVNIHGTRVD